MSFPFFGRVVGRGHNALLIDVESGSITFVLYSKEKFKTGDPGAILFLKRVFIPRGKTFSNIHAKKEFEEIFTEGRLAISKFGSISSIQISLGAPWAYTRAFQLSRTSEEPVNFSKETEEEMLKNKESQNIYFDYFKSFLGNIALPVRIKLSDKKQVFINGYPYSSYKDKEGTEFAIIGEEYVFIQWMVEVLSKNAEYLAVSDPYFFPYNTALPFLKNEAPYLFVIIGAYSTEVGYVDGVSKSIRILKGFPVGERTLVNELEVAGKLTSVEAESLLNLYSENVLHPNFSTTKRKILEDVEEMWVKKLEKLLNEISTEIKIPRTVFLVPFERPEWAKHLLEVENYARPNLPEKSWNVIMSNEFCRDKNFISSPVYPHLEPLILYLRHTFAESKQ